MNNKVVNNKPHSWDMTHHIFNRFLCPADFCGVLIRPLSCCLNWALRYFSFLFGKKERGTRLVVCYQRHWGIKGAKLRLWFVFPGIETYNSWKHMRVLIREVDECNTLSGSSVVCARWPDQVDFNNNKTCWDRTVHLPFRTETMLIRFRARLGQRPYCSVIIIIINLKIAN